MHKALRLQHLLPLLAAWTLLPAFTVPAFNRSMHMAPALSALVSSAPASSAPAPNAPAQRTGPDRRGRDLQQFYLSLDVEHRWIAGMHVDWATGIADKPDATAGNHTHCSAFVAAACQRRGIYILRPPEHGQILLANAQYEWLPSEAGRAAGWRPLDNAPLPQLYWEVQQRANSGAIIVAIIRNPDEHLPGHIALIMPKEVDRVRVETEGPVMIQAGKHNFNYISLEKGFHSHLREWPSPAIRFYIVSG